MLILEVTFSIEILLYSHNPGAGTETL